MNRLLNKVIKVVSNKDINVKKNYKIMRGLQEVLNPNFLYKKDYEDIEVDLSNRKITCRIFKTNKETKKNKVIIYIHGGGWVTGSIDSYTRACVDLSKQTNRIVISIDYRLAPEYPYPAGFNDCYEIVKLFMDNLNELGLNRKDVCLMGDSAGGNLVAAISLKAMKEKTFKVKEQILLYPALQGNYTNTTKYKSVIEKGKDYLLTQKQLQDYISLYVPNKKDLKSPYVCPLNKRILFNQPRTLIITCENDPLRDEGKYFAKKLKLYFNDVEYYNLDGAIHGVFNNSIDKKHKVIIFNKIKLFLGDNNE